jgi:MFS family permease
MVNANRLLWAGFFAILAAGVGFAVRGGILDNWGTEYNLTAGELGEISGYGFTGFCFGIIIGGVLADKIGYGWLVIAAFVLHVVSAVVTFAPTAAMSKETVYSLLMWGSFIFAYANGTLEAVANPLVATLFPQNRTHYLNILHASWPGGLVLGSAMGWVLDDEFKVYWKYQLALYLIPVVFYGILFLAQKMPKSEASAKGLSLGEMFKDVGLFGAAVACFLLALFFGSVISKFVEAEYASTAGYVGYGIGGALLLIVAVMTRGSPGAFLLFTLFVAHALVGAVELGTDNWAQNITGNLLTSAQGKFLFVWTSLVMFSLRFCSNFIERRMRLSPVGILLVCSVLACIGLNLTSMITTFGMAMLALTVYAVGKTFFWPTMLAVASDRFPRTGAVAISFMGGIGMMSAGLIGTPGLGYAKDRFAGEELQKADPAGYAQIKSDKASKFLVFSEAHGLDGKKLGEVKDRLKKAREEAEKEGKLDLESALAKLSAADRAVVESEIKGDRKTLIADSAIPALMAVIYLAILLYFKAIGGYKAVQIEVKAAEAPPAAPGPPPPTGGPPSG